MSVEEIKEKLKHYIDEGNKLKISELQPASKFMIEYIDSPAYKKWCKNTYSYIKNTFGDNELVQNYYNIITTTACEFEDGASDLVATLESFYEMAEVYLTKGEKRMDNANKVFIVHGHDELAKVETARFIEKLGFEAIILHEQCNKGQTIIEKLESHTDVGFGIVLYTPCDVGGKDKDTLFKRARQNVVFEHGYLISKLGRKNVIALVKESVECPGDIAGIVYETMDDNGAWKFKVAKEMKEIGLDVDMNKIY